MADNPPFDPDPDSSEGYEDSPGSSTVSDLPKDGTVTYGADEEWPTSIRCSYNGFSDSDVVDQHHPQLAAGHVLPIEIPPRSFLVMIVMVLPGFLHGAIPGHVTHYPAGATEPGRHRTLFIGHKQYLVRLIEIIEDDDIEEDYEDYLEEEDYEDYPEEDFEGNFVVQESSELRSPHVNDDDLSLEGHVDGSAPEVRGEPVDDGSDWDEDGEWEWAEWTPESIESFSTLPLYSPPSTTPPPPPYASPSQTSTTIIDPLTFEHSPTNTPRIDAEGQTRPLGQVVCRDVHRSEQHSRLDSRVDVIDSDDEDGEWEEATDSEGSFPSPPFTPLLGQSALWTGTEDGGPIAIPPRELPHLPTTTPQIGMPTELVNNIHSSAGSDTSPVINDDPLAPRPTPRLSPLDEELLRLLPSSSTAASSTGTSPCPTDTVASTNETTFVAQSSTSQITVVSPPVVHDGHVAQVALPIDPDLRIAPQEPSSCTRSLSYGNTQSPTQFPIVSPDVQNIYDSYDSPLRRAHDLRSPYVCNTQAISPTSSCLRLIPQDSSRPTSSMCGSYANSPPPVQFPFFRIDPPYSSRRMAGDPRSPRSGYDAPPTSPNPYLIPPPLTGSLCGSYVSSQVAAQSPYVRANVEYDSSPSKPDDPRSPRCPTVFDLSRPGIPISGLRNPPPHEMAKLHAQRALFQSHISIVPRSRVDQLQGSSSSTPWDMSHAQDGNFPLPSPALRCDRAEDPPVGLGPADEDPLTAKEHERWLAERRRMFPEPVIWPASCEETATPTTFTDTLRC